jgi:excinuclease ABC subunit C
VQRIRDEAHRCAITHHRTLRDSAFTHSRLDDIPGIGPKRRQALLRRFGSAKRVLAATKEELMQVSGMTAKAAEAIRAWAGEQSRGKQA